MFRHIGVHVLPVGGGQNAGGHCEIHPFYVAVFRRVCGGVCNRARICNCARTCNCTRTCACNCVRARFCASPRPAGAVARGYEKDGQGRQLRTDHYFLAPIGKHHVGINSLIVRI